MTISVSASDIQYGVTKANGREIAAPTRGPAVVATAQNQTTTAGKNCINIHNQFSQFPLTDINLVMVIATDAGTFSGVVTQEGVGVARVVVCYRRSDKHFVQQTTSDATTGAFTFTGLKAGIEYFVVYFDDESVLPNFNAKIFDQVVPV